MLAYYFMCQTCPLNAYYTLNIFLFIHLLYMCVYKISLFFSSFSPCITYQTFSRCLVKEEENGVHIHIQFGAHGCFTDV